MPPIVGPDGTTWNLHRAGNPPVAFGYSENDGTPINLQTGVVTFKVTGGPTVTLIADPSSSTDMLVVFSDTDLSAIPPRGGEYRIKNETTGDVLLFGKVFISGAA